MMVGSRIRLAAVTAFCLLTAACASAPGYDTADLSSGWNTAEQPRGVPLQCVPYARAHSQVKIYGDAADWWSKADGLYARSEVPQLGSVLVLTGYAGPRHSHVAVVSAMMSSREIRVDHANWLNDGAIFTDDPVVDVSPDNDWSQVKVFNERTGAWGARIYLVQGFIGPGRDNPLVAANY
jgi:hypothetical protein